MLVQRISKTAALWLTLLACSMFIHLWLYQQANNTIVDVAAAPAKAQVTEINLVTEPEPEEDTSLDFDEPPELTPPEVLLNTTALEAPPPDVELALEAAAGNGSSGGSISDLSRLPQINAGEGAAGFGDAVGIGLDQSSNSFAAYIDSLSKSGLDVVFVIDVTGSMDWVIAEVNERIIDIGEVIRGLVPVARFGVVAYRDFGDPEFVTKIQPLTFSQQKISRFLEGLEAKGGGSYQEAISEALTVAVNDSGWRRDAQKVVILIGDAPPHEENFETILKLASALGSQNGQVSILDVSHDSNPALIEASVGRAVNYALYRNQPMMHYQAIADAGEGIAATMDGDIQVTRQLLNLIMGGQFSQQMSLLMEGL
ncbi:MAG: VWA domain-containing protein [Alteromonadaceae bacterium TMED7]|nr:MAG: VWA domain-containing protein [Alteromonadaceae bacterium TMED7]|tara:strand:- start:21314 stop:22420 length:1107 start_codon:yes stop_codon:yes gene_type:complete